MQTIGIVGAKGYVGSALVRALQARPDVQGIPITRENYVEYSSQSFDVLINCAMPAARFWAKQFPEKDFVETVEKTAKLVYGWQYQRFIQISSVSARCQRNTVYGRHKAAAEALCDPSKSLIIRLGSMFDSSLKKGVLIDMLQGKKVFVDGESRYCFASLDFCANWIASHLDQIGLVELGARDTLSLKEIAHYLKREIEFEGLVDHQEIQSPQADFPSAREVFDFLDKWESKT